MIPENSCCQTRLPILALAAEPSSPVDAVLDELEPDVDYEPEPDVPLVDDVSAGLSKRTT